MLIHTPSDIYFKRAGGTRAQERARGARYISQTELINLERAGGRSFRLEHCRIGRRDPLGWQDVLYPAKWLRNSVGTPNRSTAALINRCAAPYHRPKVASYALRTKHTCVSRFFYPKNSPCSSLGTPNSGTLVYLVSFTPKTHDVPFWGPRSPARSRYCASPEASIMRLKAAAKVVRRYFSSQNGVSI